MIQFRQSRFKLAVLTVMLAIWTAVAGLLAFVSAHADGLWPYLALSLFGPLAIAGAVAASASIFGFHCPATLTFDGETLTYKTWRRTRTISRADIAAFVVIPPTGALRSPGCELESGPRRFVSFGRCWEKSAEEITQEFETAGLE